MGRARKVLIQAPKNGFFYVLDRATGELLSAEKFGLVSWASHVDLKTGRPVENPDAVWEEESAFVAPHPMGAHSWHPMSLHPGTGWVYIPTGEFPYLWEPDPEFEFRPGRLNTAEDAKGAAEVAEWAGDLRFAVCSPTALLAWDPVRQAKVWEVRHDTIVNGGVLTTGGNLAFQGNGTGRFAAYDVRNGDRLWESDVGVGVMAGPATYRIDGEQYVAVLAGVGGGVGSMFHRTTHENPGRVLAWKLGGKAPLPRVSPKPVRAVEAPVPSADETTLRLGRDAYAEHCMRCHAPAVKATSIYPDLRYSSREVHARWDDIVLGGIRAGDGMASFADVIDAPTSRAIQAYVIDRAHHEPGALESLVGWFAESPLCVPTSWMLD